MTPRAADDSASDSEGPITPRAAEIFGLKPKAHKKQKGGFATLYHGGLIEDLDPNSETHGDLWYGAPGQMGIGQKMERDAYVRQSLEYLRSPLLNADWRFRAASKDPIDQEIAAACTHAFLERLPFKRVIAKAFRGYARDGFYLAEETTDFVDVNPDRFPAHQGRGQMFAPTGYHERPAWSIMDFRADTKAKGRLGAVRQWLRNDPVDGSSYAEIKADHLLRFTWDQDGADFRGMPLLRSAYGDWKAKQIFRALWAIKNERTAVGTPTATLAEDADPDDIEALELALAELRANERGFMILPNGYALDWFNEDKASGAEIEAAIGLCNVGIVHNVAAGFMLLGLNGEVGSFALGGTQQGQLHLQVSMHADFIADTFNRGADGWSPVRRFVAANYGERARAPALEARNLPTRDWQEVAKTAATLAQGGVIRKDARLESQLRDMLQLDPYDPETAFMAGAKQ